MSLLKSWGGALARPYVRITKDLAQSYQNITSSLSSIRSSMQEKETDEKVFVNAPNSAAAFELLFKKNNWTTEALALQLKAMKRAKWISLVLAWILLSGLVAIGIIADGPYGILIGSGCCLMGAVVFAVNALRLAIYQTQIEDRALIRFNEFMSRPDFWARIFS
ncbi:Uncharacterised protein [Achromobacter sp. 2789STDY5608633]|jgi:hypothetical protein|uniref:hypothetical protein n=1 Tax=Achromobacter sp. 2789STDY5608633 TaxID=1806501 RepID=UPI0006C18F2B|nr:hypothetical protein [Achromobacter sp. 2789STDY5608633]CUJ51309.1 Uncharacterised protein [Achromobacter sp. 2789STDY5608633]